MIKFKLYDNLFAERWVEIETMSLGAEYRHFAFSKFGESALNLVRIQDRCHNEILKGHGVADAKEFALFGTRDARVCREAVKMVEARDGRPGRQRGATQFAEKS